MNTLKDEVTGKVLFYQCKFDELEGKVLTVVDWVTTWSDKYKGEMVYLYCISSKGKDLLITTFSWNVLQWCIHHKLFLPLKVKCVQDGNTYRIENVEKKAGGQGGKVVEEETEKGEKKEEGFFDASTYEKASAS